MGIFVHSNSLENNPKEVWKNQVKRRLAKGSLAIVLLLVASSSAGLNLYSASGYAAPSLPPLPHLNGCFVLKSDSWTELSCATKQEIANIPRPEEGGKYNNVYGMGSASVIQSGYIFYLPSVPSSPGVTDSIRGPGAFSAQANSNGFVGSNGQADAVQFTDQNNPNTHKNYACITQVDSTTQDYTSSCAFVTFTLDGLYGVSYLFISGEASSGSIELNFCVTAPIDKIYNNCYAVETSDIYNLEGSWTTLTGTILGLGDSSQANFVAGSTMKTLVGLQYPTSPAESGEVGLGTGETNNLPPQTYVGSISCEASNAQCYVETTA